MTSTERVMGGKSQEWLRAAEGQRIPVVVGIGKKISKGGIICNDMEPSGRLATLLARFHDLKYMTLYRTDETPPSPAELLQQAKNTFDSGLKTWESDPYADIDESGQPKFNFLIETVEQNDTPYIVTLYPQELFTLTEEEEATRVINHGSVEISLATDSDEEGDHFSISKDWFTKKLESAGITEVDGEALITQLTSRNKRFRGKASQEFEMMISIKKIQPFTLIEGRRNLQPLQREGQNVTGVYSKDQMGKFISPVISILFLANKTEDGNNPAIVNPKKRRSLEEIIENVANAFDPNLPASAQGTVTS